MPDGYTDYSVGTATNQHALATDPFFQDCSLKNINHGVYWRGHVKLWIANSGQPLPTWEANPGCKATLFDGRKAYWADVIEIPGIALSVEYRGIVGYQERYDLPLNQQSKEFFEFLDLIADLEPAVKDEVNRIVDAQTHLYFNPVQYNGPYLYYINSDQDVYADQSITFANAIGFKSEQQLYPGYLPPAIVVGPTKDAVAVGTITVGGSSLNLFTAPALKG